MGNGAKAQQKRERNAQAGQAGPSSQLKSNAQAMNKKCNVCMTPLLSTTSKKGLDEHATNKHNKTGVDCFGAEIYAASK